MKYKKKEYLNQPVTIYITESEKELLDSIIPKEQNVSSFLRKLLIPLLKAEKFKQKYTTNQ
jgi:hypothetical protein